MVGEAARRLKTANEDVTFDFNAPKLHMQDSTRKAFGRREVEQSDPPQLCGKCESEQVPNIEDNPELAVPRAVRNTIFSVVNATFPIDPRTGAGGMTRKDRKVWSAWQEILDDVWDEETTTFTIPRSMADWMLKLFEDEKIALSPSIAQFAEAVADSLRSIEPAGLAPVADDPAAD